VVDEAAQKILNNVVKDDDILNENIASTLLPSTSNLAKEDRY
jgi:hypothetical protein